MSRIIFLLLLIMQTSLVLGQKTRGKVYANNQVLEDVFILNNSQNIIEKTDINGDFVIVANLGDSLTITASFYATQRFKIKPYQLEEVWVVELKEDLNQLEAVQLSETKSKDVAAIIAQDSESILARFHEDVKANPGKYGMGPKGNIGWIVNKIIGLLSTDKKDEGPEYISFKDLKDLYENENLFTAQLLSEQLNIPEQHHNLFLEYCSTKYLKIDLLEQDRHFELLDRLVNCSKQFQSFLKESGDSE